VGSRINLDEKNKSRVLARIQTPVPQPSRPYLITMPTMIFSINVTVFSDIFKLLMLGVSKFIYNFPFKFQRH
jgi:hypothetical protein